MHIVWSKWVKTTVAKATTDEFMSREMKWNKNVNKRNDNHINSSALAWCFASFLKYRNNFDRHKFVMIFFLFFSRLHFFFCIVKRIEPMEFFEVEGRRWGPFCDYWVYRFGNSQQLIWNEWKFRRKNSNRNEKCSSNGTLVYRHSTSTFDIDIDTGIG